MNDAHILERFVFPYINFFIFIAIIYFSSKKSLSQIFKSKKVDYDALFNKAKQNKEEAESKLAEIQKRLANLDEEFLLMKERILSDAKREASLIIEKAQANAKRIHEDAIDRGRYELERINARLRDEVLSLAEKKYKETLKEKMSPEQHLRLVHDNAVNLKPFLKTT